ncbi:SIR2 family protein [Candidatus Parcubacteria bacterium]|nr:SIR2 family protein [Patescibacteria group bacterium]MBU4309677.1 SIR2 family protein [Patescibacteria group bacterium]MBU4431999.1 SIR2 family protein [Patescibacteria group bacterium]MBU4577935.1 SIR2 family protein [Patescibacteria group bacterium]MCG2696556.1 SIR2 family protein [Candidatus Parcubacteria bacterium]
MNNKELITEIKEITQSANVNFLLGSGVSTPFLPILGNIELDINSAIEKGKINDQANGYKEYYEKIMLPNKCIILNDFNFHKNFKWDTVSNAWIERTLEEAEDAFKKTKQAYTIFFQSITKIILERKTTILNKQVNVFTTNIDIFMESILEELQIDYNDGFSGRLNPHFSLSNFKKSIFQRSLHFDHKSEIPIFNIFKIHGSLTWKYGNENNIIFSPKLEHFNKTLISKKGTNFINNYKKNILVVNPENAKFSETVLNKYYYELLRSYSSELERENSVLFVIGFSMGDQHIKEITQRAAKSNPTLKIFIFVHSKDKKDEMINNMNIQKFTNIKVVAPEYIEVKDKYKYDLETISQTIFNKVNFKKNDDEN